MTIGKQESGAVAYAKAGIISRLWRRLKLTWYPEDPERMVIPKWVIPVTQVDELLKVVKFTTQLSGNLAVGAHNVLQVPKNKRWRVYNVEAARSTQDRTCQGIYVTDGTYSLPIYTAAAAAVLDSGVLAEPVPMDEEWYIRIDITGGTTDGAWDVTALVEEEDAY